jgi:Tfp pilus assembly major pilin PilA
LSKLHIKKLKSLFQPLKNQDGFTFFEFIMVCVVIALVAAIAMQRVMSVAEDAEIASENSTVGNLRQNITNIFLENLARGNAPQYALNPFENLTKAPSGYDRRRIFPPNGLSIDDELWVFVPGGETSSIKTASGQTITTVIGTVWHQRRDHTVVNWEYDSSGGIIAAKNIVQKSDLKLLSDNRKTRLRLRTEDDIRFGRNQLNLLTRPQDAPADTARDFQNPGNQ